MAKKSFGGKADSLFARRIFVRILRLFGYNASIQEEKKDALTIAHEMEQETKHIGVSSYQRSPIFVPEATPKQKAENPFYDALHEAALKDQRVKEQRIRDQKRRQLAEQDATRLRQQSDDDDGRRRDNDIHSTQFYDTGPSYDSGSSNDCDSSYDSGSSDSGSCGGGSFD